MTVDFEGVLMHAVQESKQKIKSEGMEDGTEKYQPFASRTTRRKLVTLPNMNNIAPSSLNSTVTRIATASTEVIRNTKRLAKTKNKTIRNMKIEADNAIKRPIAAKRIQKKSTIKLPSIPSAATINVVKKTSNEDNDQQAAQSLTRVTLRAVRKSIKSSSSSSSIGVAPLIAVRKSTKSSKVSVNAANITLTKMDGSLNKEMELDVVENKSVVRIRLTPNVNNTSDLPNSTATATISVTKTKAGAIRLPERKIQIQVSDEPQFQAPIVTLRVKRLRS